MNSYCASIFNWALSNSIHIARTLSVRPAKAKHQNRHQSVSLGMLMIPQPFEFPSICDNHPELTSIRPWLPNRSNPP